MNITKKASFRRYGRFALLDDHSCLLSIENTPAVLDTTRINIVHEMLAILLTVSKLERLS